MIILVISIKKPTIWPFSLSILNTGIFESFILEWSWIFWFLYKHYIHINFKTHRVEWKHLNLVLVCSFTYIWAKTYRKGEVHLMRLRNMDYLLNFKLKLKTEFTHKWQFLNTPFPNQFKILQSWGKGNNDCKPHWDLINSMPKQVCWC